MPSPLLSRDEIAKLGQELYNRHIRSQVEVAENIGKIVSIDIETGEYEVGDELVETSLGSQSKHPNALLWAERIGSIISHSLSVKSLEYTISSPNLLKLNYSALILCDRQKDLKWVL